ncbi:MAG: DeoR/GlpR family DNA-binding transcription regulator [Brevinema sp.]
MLRQERLKHILHYLEMFDKVTINELAKEFDLSPITIRLDIKYLAHQGFVNRNHGSVSLLKQNMYLGGNLADRKQENYDLKNKLLKLASYQINPGDTIFLDDSTTVANIIPFLIPISGLTIVTHSLEIISKLKEHSHIHTIGLGGTLCTIDQSFIGPTVLAQLENIHIDIAFISCWSLDILKYTTETSHSASIIKQKTAERSKKIILVMTSNKFNNHHELPTVLWEDIDLIISDFIPNDILDKKKFIILPS